ncbi:hypothetical protein LXJ58_34000, partial [Escherichia coli]|nr:hypothetical protein [Escherichia coli]
MPALHGGQSLRASGCHIELVFPAPHLVRTAPAGHRPPGEAACPIPVAGYRETQPDWHGNCALATASPRVKQPQT